MAAWREQLQALWFRPELSVRLWPLLPLSWIFVLIAAVRRFLYRHRLLPAVTLDRPVVIVGNILVGGTGKTPLVIELARRLRLAGRRPGIVTRGFGGSAGISLVSPDADPRLVGDEPLLLARHCGAPVVVGRDRVAAAQALFQACPEVDIVVCDDGLQHYRLRRDVEIAIVDARGFGNGHRLPAGPLREATARLRGVAAVVCNGDNGLVIDAPGVPRFAMTLRSERFVALGAMAETCGAAELSGRQLCAVAGIGDPQRFFAVLSGLGLVFEARAFPDHHAYSAADLAFAAGRVLLMTEKDAVKCRGFYFGEAWYLPVTAVVEPDLAALVLEKIDGRQIA